MRRRDEMTDDERRAIIEAVPDNYLSKAFPAGRSIYADVIAVRRAVEARIRRPKEAGMSTHFLTGELAAYKQFADWLDGKKDPREELE